MISDEAVKTFTETWGLTLDRRSKVPEMGIEAAYFAVGETTFELVTPGNDAETNLLRKQLDRSGEGLYMLGFRVDDIHAAVAELREKGCTVTDPVGDEALEAFISPRNAHGVRLMLIERP